MDSNWYVIYCMSQKEEQTAASCQFRIPKEILKECFVPKYKRKMKLRGKWQIKEDVLFKGYIFMITDNIDDLFQELKKVPEMTKLLGNDGENIYSLPQEEVQFLLRFAKDDHIVEMSYGVIEGDKIIINEGPLVGQEGLIKKIDRHKRIAMIEVNFFGQITEAKVGLEIISKT